MKKFYCSILFALVGILSLQAQPGQLSMQPFSTGFTEPLFVTHAGDDRIFVVEKAGKIYILNQQGVRIATPYLNIDPRVNSAASERGLLGLAFHPNYKQNGYLYVNYTNSTGSTVISRFSVTADPNVADPNSEQIMLTITQPYSNHNGGCINFGPDGYLYIGTGDGGSGGDPGDRAQDGLELLGKFLRIDVDNGLPYTIPPSNPYYGLSSVRNEIWGFGARNPWRWSFDKVTGDMWIGDVGQDTQEEIDFWPDTATTFPNFGWRCYEASLPYNTSGCQPQSFYDAPVYFYNQTQGSCSVTGGYMYRGARFQSMWGTYFHTDYCSGYLWSTRDNGLGGWTTTRSSSPFSSNNLVSFGEDHFGEIYLTGISTGIIYHLVDTTCTPFAFIPGGDTVTVCQPSGMLSAFGGPALDYQWQLGGLDIPGANTADLLPTVVGDYRVIVRNGSCTDTSNVVHVKLSNSPTVSFSLPLSVYCDQDVPAASSRSPIGGTIYGPGAAGIFFDPNLAGVGVHQLVYVYTDPQSGCSGSDTFMVEVVICLGAATPQISQLNLTPNPNAGHFTLEFELSNPSPYAIEVLDLQGRLVQDHQFAGASGKVVQPLELDGLAAGLYFLHLQSEGQVAVVKFVVQP
jgi:hypothetical protein